jgi:hypothetical protein
MRARSNGADVALEGLAARISRWRRTRQSSRSRMPDELYTGTPELGQHAFRGHARRGAVRRRTATSLTGIGPASWEAAG